MKGTPHLLALGIAVTPLVAKETPVSAPATPSAAAPEVVTETITDQQRLEAANKLEAEKLTQETQSLRAEIARLKLERELINERIALEAAQRQAELKQSLSKLEAERDQLQRDGEISKLRAEKLANDLKALQAEASLATTTVESEIARINLEQKHSQYTGSSPVYLDHPLRDDGTLVISDRRIPLNGIITAATADYVTSRIEFWNNKNDKLPIFLVIDDSPGGSVMAGYRILKAMDASAAPVHVVVKSFAASMAACITTLAEESYAYPNAIILHHQISSQLAFARLNLTQQRELYQESERWWTRLASPIAGKMGVPAEAFVERMYARSSSGDWSEFGDKAKELKWVNHIVSGIQETSVITHPEIQKQPEKTALAAEEQVDAEGRTYLWLPRLNPKDVYFLYNPDGYYRMR